MALKSALSPAFVVPSFTVPRGGCGLSTVEQSGAGILTGSCVSGKCDDCVLCGCSTSRGQKRVSSHGTGIPDRVFVFNVCGYFVVMCVTCTPGAGGGQKRMQGSLGLELQTVVS